MPQKVTYDPKAYEARFQALFAKERELSDQEWDLHSKRNKLKAFEEDYNYLFGHAKRFFEEVSQLTQGGTYGVLTYEQELDHRRGADALFNWAEDKEKSLRQAHRQTEEAIEATIQARRRLYLEEEDVRKVALQS